MKKNELTELASNLLIIGSVSLAFAPFVLDDRPVWKLPGLAGVVTGWATDYTDWVRVNLWRDLQLFCYDISFRVIHRHVTKRRDLVLHLFPIPNNHDRGAIGVIVFRGRLLNVRSGQGFNLRTKVVDEVLVEVKRVDRVDTTGQSKLAGQFNGEVAGAVFLRRVQFLV